MSKPATYLGLNRWSEYKRLFVCPENPRKPEPPAYEYVIASAFSGILYLPLQCRSDIDHSVKYRIVWEGDINRTTHSVSSAPSGPDIICHARGFFILCEATLRVDRSQWKKEFTESLEHYDNFVSSSRDRNDVYLVLIAPELHELSFQGFKSQASSGYKLLLLNNTWLAKLWETSRVIPTVKNLDVREILIEIEEELSESPTFPIYKANVENRINNWQKRVFMEERHVFFALRAYQAIKKEGHDVVATSTILRNINQDSVFNSYWDKIHRLPLPELIKDSLTSEKLAKLAKGIVSREKFFSVVAVPDYKERGERLIESVRIAGG